MQRIQLWKIAPEVDGSLSASPLEKLPRSDTEAQLEELLVRSPTLLGERITLVGRQVPTAEQRPLDLLGFDEDGTLVVFELKRGTLTRDAVAQVIDYASFLAEQEAEQLGTLVEKTSGKLGIEKIDDFDDWYAEHFPDSEGALEHAPKMVLVGLDVDERARRMVDYLANAGVRIELLTFHAFNSAGGWLIARQVENAVGTAHPSSQPKSVGGNKERNAQLLQDFAKQQGVDQLLNEAAACVESNMPAYKWPGKKAFSFSLTERTNEGKATARRYVVVAVHPKERGAITIAFDNRAIQTAPATMAEFFARFSSDLKKFANEVDIKVTTANWPSIAADLPQVVADIAAGWKAKGSAGVESAAQPLSEPISG